MCSVCMQAHIDAKKAADSRKDREFDATKLGGASESVMSAHRNGDCCLKHKHT